ncbi:MAG: hypothetical protein GVY13_05740 [Alphaproteobacteria bacterium]|nr:hypothetical protein [Alphaproteobacteria bacterium]
MQRYFAQMTPHSFGMLNPYSPTDHVSTYQLCGTYTPSTAFNRQVSQWLGRQVNIDALAQRQDPTLAAHGVQYAFARPNGLHAGSVRVIESSDDDIFFWFVTSMVTEDETAQAAEMWCERHAAGAQYIGAASGCFLPGQQLAMLGHRSEIVQPVAITGYRCL